MQYQENRARLREFSFDLWGTLIQPSPDFAAARLKLLHDFCGCPPEAAGAALRQVKSQYDSLAVGQGRATPAPHIFQSLLAALNCRRPCGPLMEAYYALFCAHPPRLLTPDGLALLTLWAARYRLHLISNTLFVPGSVLSEALRGVFSVFASLTFSDEVGYSKPHPRVFARAYAQMQVPKRSVTHIGNDPSTDIAGAKAFGFETFLVAAAPGPGLRQAWETLAL